MLTELGDREPLVVGELGAHQHISVRMRVSLLLPSLF